MRPAAMTMAESGQEIQQCRQWTQLCRLSSGRRPPPRHSPVRYAAEVPPSGITPPSGRLFQPSRFVSIIASSPAVVSPAPSSTLHFLERAADGSQIALHDLALVLVTEAPFNLA